MSEYPECEKLSRTSQESQKLGAFLDWLSERGICLAEYPKTCAHHNRWEERENHCKKGNTLDPFDCGPGCNDFEEEEESELRPTQHRIERLLADYFEIDLVKVEEERRAMLESLQQQAN